MENSTLLTEKPIQGRAAPDNTRGGSGITRPKDEFFKKDKNFIRNVISGMNQKAFRKEGVGTFDKLVTAIKGSTSASPLKKAKCLKIAGKIRGMSTCEEVSRRNKPSNIKKKKTLDAALEKLKKKREYSKEDFEGVLRKDDPARRTPGKTITTKAKTVGYEKGDLPADKKKKLPKSKSTAIVKTDDKTDDKNDKKQKLTPNTPGKDRVAQGGPIEKAKEKEKQGIKDYTNKKKGVIARRKAKERLKNAAKNLAQGAADNATKVTGGVASAYGTSSFKEDRTSNWRSELSEVAPALALPLIPLANKAIATGAAAWSLYNMSKRRKESPGQMNIPGFQRTWGKSKPDPVRDELNKRRDASKTRKVNKAQSAAARDRENAARKSRGEGELNNPEN